MRLPAIAAALAATFAALIGCSGDDEGTPAACLQGASTYLDALEAAPGEVRLEGETPISECPVPDQQAADLAEAGDAMVRAATQLNAAARREPAGRSTVELGYLAGAVQRGAAETGGIHADLVRRLDAAARHSPGGLLPASFERAFGRGYAAGQESG